MRSADELGRRIDAYLEGLPPAIRRNVAASYEGGPGVPRALWVGEPDEWGWVETRALPSTVSDAELDGLEAEYDLRLPPSLRAYFQARLLAHDQVHARRHGHQLILLPSLLPPDPLEWFRPPDEVLLPAGLLSFASWGDGWGPLCFDLRAQGPDGECPILWIDHEHLARLDSGQLVDRAVLAPFERRVYASGWELWEDVFDA